MDVASGATHSIGRDRGEERARDEHERKVTPGFADVYPSMDGYVHPPRPRAPLMRLRDEGGFPKCARHRHPIHEHREAEVADRPVIRQNSR